jgi:hypothetical protein
MRGNVARKYAYLLEYSDVISIVVVGEVHDAVGGVGPDPLDATVSVRHPSWLAALFVLEFGRHRCWTKQRKKRVHLRKCCLF